MPGDDRLRWAGARLAHFACELGTAKARWAGRVPSLPWLSRRWLAQYLAEGPPRVTRVADGLMDVALLPEIAVSATDGWFAPAIAGRAARDHIGQSSYGQDGSAAAAARRVTLVVTLIADWADLAAV